MNSFNAYKKERDTFCRILVRENPEALWFFEPGAGGWRELRSLDNVILTKFTDVPDFTWVRFTGPTRLPEAAHAASY